MVKTQKQFYLRNMSSAYFPINRRSDKERQPQRERERQKKREIDRERDMK